MSGYATMLPAWRNVVAAVERGEYGYGDVIPTHEMYRMIDAIEPKGKVSADDFKRWQLKVLSNVSALKDHLLERHHMMLSDHETGVGWRIVEPREQTTIAYAQGLRELRAGLNKMTRRLLFVNHQALTHEERKTNADAVARVGAMRQQFRRIDRGLLPDVPKRLQREK